MQLRFAALVAFVSGFVALGYEILWARRLSDIIGATFLASSLVVGVFFMALAAGALCLGPLASRHPSPWKLYGLLELGILACILPSFFGEQLSGVLAWSFGGLLLAPTGGAVVKASLAILFVGSPSFLMGGTLPALGQAVVSAGRLGHEGNALYGLNTLGGAAGILCTTFACIPALGMRGSFLLLMLGSLGLAVVALRAGARWAATSTAAAQPPASRPRPHKVAKQRASTPAWSAATKAWLGVAALSGFLVLGFEILGLHLFSQVLHNSSYTFASVLVVVIVALAVGALVTQRWSVDERSAWLRLGVLLLLAGCAAAVLPRLFLSLTNGMRPFGGGSGGFANYILGLLGTAALVLGPPFVLLGWVFPLVLAGSGRGAVGAIWGRLLAVNAAGALLGLMLANHVAMPMLGLWGALFAWSIAMLAGGACVALRLPGRSARFGMLALVALGAGLLALTPPGSLPMAYLERNERVVAWRAGAAGVAAVIDQPQDRRIKWNNTYSLGGSTNAAQQARLGYLPLLLHPAPRYTAFIGAATGITASSALRDPAVETLTAIELSPQTMALACEYFRQWNADLCNDRRTRTVVEDGRLFFRATQDSFDVVVADLFVPWRSGVANLYTREHFQSVRRRLRHGGLFAQWLPLFQLDAQGFWGIAATFCDVFPNAWLAIADFQPSSPGVVLIGWRETSGAPDTDVLAKRCVELGALPVLREPLLRDPAGVALFLVGPVRPALPTHVPLMTLDMPWLADHAPRVQRLRPTRYLVGADLVAALQGIARHVPDGPLRAPVLLGQQLFAFCELFERQGPEQAAAWYGRNVGTALPAHLFAVPGAGQMSWPFTFETGMFLLQRAEAQSRSRDEGPGARSP